MYEEHEATVFDHILLPLIFGFVRSKNTILPALTEDLDDRNSGIRCPACRWRPTRQDVWACNPGCGHVWNTFDTRGHCPGCQKHWSKTQCTKCGEWSNHDAWYESPAGVRS
jgi:hypothetical protein